MDLFLVGLSHKTAPVSIREKLDFSSDHSNRYLEKLLQSKLVESAVILSTCNRVEIYASGRDDTIPAKLKNFIADFHRAHDLDLDMYLYLKKNDEAIKHLFSVASSLDSVVVGEPQILGQVKDAYDVSKKFGLIDSFFELFLQKTFSVAKKIRNETDIGKLTVSISSMAVELSNKIYDTLHGKAGLVLGAGEMAEICIEHLKKKGIEKVWIANRTFETAAQLAKQYDAYPIYLEQFGEILSSADIVISATGMNGYLIDSKMVKESLDARKQSPQLFVDISVPRNIDPEVGNIQNAYLYNIDDLQQMVSENKNLRVEASKKAYDLIENETKLFVREIEQKNFSPTIQRLQKKIARVIENEWKRSFPGSVDEKSTKFLQSIQQKLTSAPIQYLKDLENDTFEQKVSNVEKIFDLESDEES